MGVTVTYPLPAPHAAPTAPTSGPPAQQAPPAPTAGPPAQPGQPVFVPPAPQAPPAQYAPVPPPVPQFTAPAPLPPLPPAPAPQPPTPQPAPPAPQQPPASGGPGQPGQLPATGAHPDGFPPNTPWRDMRPEEQTAYWQHQARRHEQRVRDMGDYDQLKEQATQYQQMVTAAQSEQERAVAEAHRQGRAAALAETGGQLAEQWLRAAAHGRMSEQSVNALLSGLDRSRFLTPQGAVDTDKVYTFVNSVAPAPVAQQPPVPPAAGAPGTSSPPAPPPPQQVLPYAAPSGGPDFGQGQPGSVKPSGLAAGKQIAEQRFAAANPKP